MALAISEKVSTSTKGILRSHGWDMEVNGRITDNRPNIKIIKEKNARIRYLVNSITKVHHIVVKKLKSG